MPIEDDNDEQVSFSPPPMLEREDWQDEIEEIAYIPPRENGINGHSERTIVNGRMKTAAEIKIEIEDEEYEDESNSGDDTISYADSDRFSSASEDFDLHQRELEDKENAERFRRNNSPRITQRYYPREVEETSNSDDEMAAWDNIIVGPGHCPQFINLLPEGIQSHMNSLRESSTSDVHPSVLDSDDFHRHGILPTTSGSISEKEREPYDYEEEVQKRQRNTTFDILQREWLMLDPYMFDDIFRCFVCHDIVQWNIILTCDHIFCTACLTGIEENCPKCKAPIGSTRHDDLIEKLISRLKLDSIRKQKPRQKFDNPFTSKNLPLYATVEQQAACSSSQVPEPLCSYSLPHFELIELTEEELQKLNTVNYRDLLKRPRLSRRTINSKFDHRLILNLSKLGCPVILRPRNIRVNVRRKTIHLILPETSYIGHLEEYMKKWIKNEMSSKNVIRIQVAFRRICYSRMKKDIKLINKRNVEVQNLRRYKEPMMVYCQKIGEPRLHSRWTLNQYRIHNKISQTSPLEFTYDVKPLTQYKSVRK